MAGTRTKIEWLLDDLCRNFGFSLPIREHEQFEKIGLEDIDRFTTAIFVAEGLDPHHNRALREQVGALVAKFAGECEMGGGHGRAEVFMREKKWLDGYSGQNTNELIRLQGEYRTDSIVLAFEEALAQKAKRIAQDSLTTEEKIVLAIEGLEQEVNNGGYGQFFINASKDHALIVVDALNRIGCPEVALLAQQALDALGIEGQLTVQAIQSTMEDDNDERNEKLGTCDDRYYKVAGDLASPLLEFIKKNKDYITVNG